jgi:hypothetical protein
MKMKLTNYTVETMKREIQEHLFIYWLKSGSSDWEDPDMREIWLLWHDAMASQIVVVDD